MNYQALHDELINDPLARGYSGMNDEQAATNLNTPYRVQERLSIGAAELYEAIVQSEWTPLTAAQKEEIRDMYLLGTIQTVTGSRGRAVLIATFPAGSATRTKLLELMTTQTRRCDEIGWPQGVTNQDVAHARAM